MDDVRLAALAELRRVRLERQHERIGHHADLVVCEVIKRRAQLCHKRQRAHAHAAAAQREIGVAVAELVGSDDDGAQRHGGALACADWSRRGVRLGVLRGVGRNPAAHLVRTCGEDATVAAADATGTRLQRLAAAAILLGGSIRARACRHRPRDAPHGRARGRARRTPRARPLPPPRARFLPGSARARRAAAGARSRPSACRARP
mmetsp:Transcript_11335/g.47329  ORF Transcript_11335/g.47329 Transcript_11335/m.47329 type:complete len:205 (+) Transcript_11335:5431-6045(+)